MGANDLAVGQVLDGRSTTGFVSRLPVLLDASGAPVDERPVAVEPFVDTLSHGLGRDIAATLLACMSPAALRTSLGRSGLVYDRLDDEALFRRYFHDKALRELSPNILFDEAWYRQRYPDVGQAVRLDQTISGFVHFVAYGIFEGRWPNPVVELLASLVFNPSPVVDEFDEQAYLAATPYAELFLRSFPVISPTRYYRIYGRMLGDKVAARGRPQGHQTMLMEFDHEHYARNYMASIPGPHEEDAAFAHYLTTGVCNSYDPNSWFNEAWYRAFYPDVRAAITSREMLCGFQHFVLSGRSEGRLPAFNLTQALEARLPGVTHPALLLRVPDLERKLARVAFRVDPAATARVWFIMPCLNPDIAFGGYIAVLELMQALYSAGYPIGIICSDDRLSDKGYFLWREAGSHLCRLINDIPVSNIHAEDGPQIGIDDSFVAYSVWDLRTAGQFSAVTRRRRVMLLAQEYEPVFYANGAIRLLCESNYSVEHYPIINSTFLLRYLQQHKVGVFARLDAKPGRDFAVFEHRVNPLPRQTASGLARRSSRTLVAYARPESHAERNLFEVLLIALRQACAKGLFGPEWSFVGVGALSSLEPISLEGGHQLVMKQKMTETEYREHVQSVDIGISLMYAPHPSVVPFELATSGAIVITNTYENRSAADLTAICKNIVPALPSVDGIVAALEVAKSRAEDFKARERNAYRPPVTRWSESFSPAFLAQAFGQPPYDGEPDLAAPEGPLRITHQDPA